MDKNVRHRVYTALMVHFSESPASRHKRNVEVRGRGGFRLVACFYDAHPNWDVRIEGDPSDDQVERLSRANDLIGEDLLLHRIEATRPDIAERVAASDEGHPWQPRWSGHHHGRTASWLGEAES